MKNNFLRLALLIVMFSFNTPFFAQDVEVHIGEESKTNRKEGIRSVYRGEDAIIVLKAKYSLIGSTTYILEVFDNKMNLASRNEVELPDRDLMFSEMSYLNGRIYFFMEKYDKKS